MGGAAASTLHQYSSRRVVEGARHQNRAPGGLGWPCWATVAVARALFRSVPPKKAAAVHPTSDCTALARECVRPRTTTTTTAGVYTIRAFILSPPFM
jgi:hypothetical protein